MIYEKIQLETDEVIVQIIHRHWFFMFKQCVVIVFFIFFPLIILISASVLLPSFMILIAPYTAAIVFLYSFWLLLNWMILATIWTNQYLDIWCVTNRRLIKIDQLSLFNRQVGSFRLERLQDINVEIRGIIATFLDFGTIHAQTASADIEEFKASYLPQPQVIKSNILKAADGLMNKPSL